MKRTERNSVIKLIQHMQNLQRQLKEPTKEDATDDEVKLLFNLCFEWTPYPSYDLPPKTMIEIIVGLIRGLSFGEYCYISGGRVAHIIRELREKRASGCELSVELNEGWEKMTDDDLYSSGKWNYKPTPFFDFLYSFGTCI